MSILIKNMTLFCVALALLVPATLRVAGVSFFDLGIYTTLAFAFVLWLLDTGAELKVNKGIELSLYGLFLVAVFSYIINSYSFDTQNAFIESIGMDSSFLFLRLSLYGAATLVMLIGVYRIVSTHLTSERALHATLKTILVAGSLNAVITIVAWYMETGGVFDRYNYLPPLEQSQGLHVKLMTFVFILAFGLWHARTLSAKAGIYLVGVMALTGFSTLTVMARQGWLTFVISILLYYFLSRRKTLAPARRSAALFLTLFLIGAVFFTSNVYQGAVQEQFSEIVDAPESDDTYGSMYMRLVLLEHGLSLFKDHLFFGVGYGHYPAFSTVPLVVSGLDSFVSSPHNGIVTLLAETGIVGFMCYCLLCWSLLQMILMSRRQASDTLTSVITSVTFVLVTIELVSQFISNGNILPIPVERPMVQYSFLLWLLISLSAGIGRNASASRHSS